MQQIYKFFSKRCVFIIFWFITIFFFTGMVLAKNKNPVTPKASPSSRIKTIVIDPGHGGHDTGAKGIENTNEKTISLSLARLIADDLKDDYAVVFTRTGDFLLNLSARTAKANTLKADLFISIHTGGSFLHTGSGFIIYYYKKSTRYGSIDQALSDASLADIHIWDNIQNKHLEASSAFAHRLQGILGYEKGDLKAGVLEAPLVVLAGADMPAVLLEIGYLTNPAEEEKLSNNTYLSELSKKICIGIKEFFEKGTKNSIIDLHE